MATTKKTSKAGTTADTDNAAWAAVVEENPTPTILADRDLNITYMNKISFDTLRKVEQYPSAHYSRGSSVWCVT